MSLIVQALKRAQEGATRRLPPFSGHQTRGPFPGPMGRSGGGRRMRTMTLIGLAIGAAVVAGGAALWVAGGSLTRAPVAKTAPQLLVVEAVPPSAPGAPGSPTPASEAGTSIEEVRAALLAAQPLETALETPRETIAAVRKEVAAPSSAAPPAAPSAAPQRPVPARTGPTRPRETQAWATTPAINSPTASPTDVPTPRPVPRPPAAPMPPAAREASAIVKVHAEPAKEAADALAAGLRNQQGGQTANAIDDYRRGIRADARNPGLHNNLGVALRESGRLDEAIEAFQAALNLDAKYEKALNNLGVSRYQQGNYADAVDLFSQALRINPANVESSVNLGMIYFLAQRWDEALNAFQQALKYNPRSAEAHYNLGLFWERHGDLEKAVQAYRKFIELAGAAHAPLAARVTEHVRQMERGK